jgi:GntR family transcriptional regulator, sialic acid-inducible nan operon repressor
MHAEHSAREDPADMQGEKIQRKKLSDEVFNRLFQAIEHGELRPGSQLPSERDLMARFGVGRPAIREAMQTLGNMGVIEISHGERARVTRPTASGVIAQIDHAARHLLSTSPQSLEHLKEAREFFEVGMASEAAQRATLADIDRLKAALAAQESFFGKDLKRFVAADMAFHSAIAAITGNPVFEAVSQAMLQWLSQYHSGVLRWKGHESITLEEHQQVLDCIAARDPEGAANAMRGHLRRTRRIYQSGKPVA